MSKRAMGIFSALVLWTILSTMIVSSAYANVTMDVDKWNGPSGTYLCKDVKTCWLLYRAAEVRGDTYYCNSVAIKRDGRIVWYKNFYPNIRRSNYDFPMNVK